MIVLEQFPLPDDRVPGEMALWIESGRYEQSTLIVYEQARDFLSAPATFVVLDCGGDAWLLSEPGDNYAVSPGIYLKPDSEHANDDEEHLVMVFADSTVEVICRHCVVAGYQVSVESAAQALKNHLA